MNKNSKKEERLGQVGYNKQGHKMTIIKYVNNAEVTVKFDSGYENTTSYQRFRSGNIKDNYSERVCGIGYLGDARYKENELAYKHWKAILSRTNGNGKNTYKDCKICNEWLNFENFVKWFNENYYVIENERMNIDKDIIKKGNKLYSPETCLIVPQSINLIFLKQKRKYKNSENLPIGVYICDNKFRVTIQKYNKTFNHGFFETKEDAFYAYKKAKEDYIKEVADRYKDQIPKRIYDILYTYEVEITD